MFTGIRYRVRFTQIVNFPTREDNTLDLILIDDVQRLLSIFERPPLGHGS